MRKRVGYFFLFLLLCVSFSLICSDWVKDAMISDSSVKLSIGNFTADEIRENTESRRAFLEEDVTIPAMNEVIREIGNSEREDVIGGILIPEAEISLPVFEGITRENLMTGVGTLKEGQVAGEGNYGLAGHHMKDSSLLFGPLAEVEKGAHIYLTDLDKIYIYKVTETEVIHQNDTEVLDDLEEAVITLITCNTSGVNTEQRLMVRGELIEQVAYEEMKNSVYDVEYSTFMEINTFRYRSYVWLLGIILAAGIITIAARLYLK